MRGLKIPKGFEDSTLEEIKTEGANVPAGFEDSVLEEITDTSKKKVGTTSVSSNGSNPTQPTSGSGVSQSRDPRGVNPKLGFLSDIVSELNPNAPKLKPGQSVDEWGKELTTFASQYPMPKENEPWKKEDSIKRMRYKVAQRKESFEQFIDEKLADPAVADMSEQDKNLYLYREYLSQNEPEKLKQYEEKLNYRSVIPGIGALMEQSPEEKQRMEAEFYDKALENSQRYLNIKYDKVKEAINTPQFQQAASMQQGSAQEIDALNKSFEAGNIDRANYESNFAAIKQRYDEASAIVAPIQEQANALQSAAQQNLSEAESWIKRYPLEAERRLREMTDDAFDEAMYNISPTQRAAANFTNQVGRGVTEFLANVVALPQVFSQDSEYGFTDHIADVSQEWAKSINDDLFPVPKKMEKGLVNENYSVNWDLVFPKTVRTLTDMGIMAATGTPAGMVATSFTMNAKGYYDEGLNQGMTAPEASRFSVLMGMQQSLLELVNPEYALLRKGVAGMATTDAMRMLSQGVSMGDVVKQVSRDIAKNVVMENTQEMSQLLGDMTGKMAANTITGSNFEFDDIGQQMKETVLLTTLVSGVAGGGISASQTSRSELEKRALLSAVEDPELLLVATQKAVMGGQLSEAAATKINMTVGNLKQNLDALPTTVSETERSEVVNALFDKSKLMEVAANENLDPGIKKVYEKKIGELDAAVSKIISKYIPKEGVETVEVETPRGVVEEEVIVPSEEGNPNDLVTFIYKNETEVPDVFKDKITSKGETNGKKEVRVTMSRKDAEGYLGKTETPATEEIVTTPTEEIVATETVDGVGGGTPKSLRGVKYSDIIVGDKYLEDILSDNKLSEEEKQQVREVFARGVDYFKFDKEGEQKFQQKFANPEDITDVADIITGVSAAQQSAFNFYNTKNYENVKDAVDYILNNPNEYSSKVVKAVKEIKGKLDNPSSSMSRLYAIDVMRELGIIEQSIKASPAQSEAVKEDTTTQKADIERRRPTSYIRDSKDKKSPLETFRNEAKREWDGVSVITGDRMKNLYVGIQLFVEAYPEHKDLLDKFIKKENGTIGITNNNLSFVLNTLKKQGVTTESELGVKINAKYDAELANLEQSTTTTIKAKKADIERRRQEEIKENDLNQFQYQGQLKSISLLEELNDRLENEKRNVAYFERNDKTHDEEYEYTKRRLENLKLKIVIAKKINAKYDAELAALDNEVKPTTDGKVNEEGSQGLLTSESEAAAPIPEAPPITEGATETETEIDEPTTQVFVSKDGSTVEETKLATLVVKDKKGKRVEPKQRAKILRQYRKEKLQGGKRIEEVDLNREGIQGEEAMRYVAENSTSPAQLLELMGKQSSNQNEMTSNDFYIAENIDTVTPESWNRFGDKNTVTKDIKKNYIHKSGTTIDEIAQAASYALNPEGDGTEISPDEVFEFMKDNPNGIKDAYIPTNPDAEMLKDAFIALTGITPTKAMITRALKEESIRFDENFAGLEPDPQEVNTASEGEIKDRRTYKRYEKLSDVSGTTKAQIPEDAKKYLVQTNKMSIAEARAMIRDIGIEETDKLIRDLNNGINGAVRTMAATVLLKTYEERGMINEHTNLTRWMFLRLTDAGQTSQAAAMLEAIKPDYTLAGSEFEYEKATGEKLPEHLRKRFEVLGKEIAALEKKAQGIKDKLKEKALEDATVNIIDSVKRESKAPAKKKMQSLSAEKKSRKAELKKKYFGIFNDFTNIPRLLVDKEFLEYNKLILEEAAGDFKNFVKILIAELGSKTRPYAREFYKAAGGTELPELEKAYYDEEGKIKIPKEVIREIVMTNDIKKADELVAKVMEYVQKDFPEATATEVKESITEYGKTVNPSKDQIDAEIRRLKRDGKLELGLKDATEGKGVKRSGLQREKPTDYQRDLMRKINEELKRYPEDLASVEKKWASALDRVKTHLKNTIADTQKRIQDIKDGIAEPLPSKKRGFELDEEAKALQEERDNLKKILAELEPKQEMSDEARVKVALAAAERAIAATADKINAQEFEYKKKKEPLNTPELTAARERLKLGKDVLNRMREESGFAEQHRYDLWKKRLQKRITDLQEKIDNKDFSVAPKKVMEINQEVLELRVKADKLKFERDVEIEKARIKSLTGLQKAKQIALDVINLPKSLMASADLSAPLRQGALLTARHPIMGLAAAKEMMKQAFSQKAQDKWVAALHESEIYPYMKHSKLFLSEPSVDLSAKEEQFISNIAEKIPVWGRVVKGSGRAYNGYLNKLRADVFSQFFYALKQEGVTGAELETQLKSYAKFINNATGRGDLGIGETSALVLNSAFFSPRYVASRFNLLNPVFYAKLEPRTRLEALKTMGTYIGIVSMTLALLSAMGDDDDEFTVELDPRSSDFGKLKWGDTRFDLLAGFQQWVRMFAQIVTGQKKSTITGEIVTLGEGYKADTRLDVLRKFFISKAAPAAAAGMNILRGKDMMGEPITPEGELLKLAIPLYVSDMYEVYKEDGIGKSVATTLPAFFGVGVQTYGKGKKQPTTREEVQAEMDRRLEKEAKAEAMKEYRDNNPKIQEQKDKKEADEDALYERAKEFDIEYIKK